MNQLDAALPFGAAQPGPARCPRCRERVIAAPGGRLLEPEPHQLGIYLPDGRRLGDAQPTNRGPGHRTHACYAQQGALFGEDPA